MVGTGKRVILYELNEVPWEVIDTYVADHPRSNLSYLLSKGQSNTTVLEETAYLQPWRTWPSFHTSQLAADHMSLDLGQDPSTFRGETIWDVVESAGLKIGLFGPMQSWPARSPQHGGFWIPDTFSSDEVCCPPTLNRFQAFNLKATRENNYSPHSTLQFRELTAVGLELFRLGLTLNSAMQLTRGVIRERIDKRNKAGRSIMQAIPGFDLYWRLHTRHRPDLSVFFTNHVAGMMHRYWGDAMDGYENINPEYVPDPIFGSLIRRAMDVADSQIGRVRRYVDRNPDSILMIAGSMGQHAVYRPYKPTQLVLSEAERFFTALNLGCSVSQGLAMYPRISLQLKDRGSPEEKTDALSSVSLEEGRPIFEKFRLTGRTLQFSFVFDACNDSSERVSYTPFGSNERMTSTLEKLGLELRDRLGGPDTGHHMSEGILLTYGNGISNDGHREGVDLLDMAPSILVNLLGVDPAPSMKGQPSLFSPTLIRSGRDHETVAD